MGEEKIIEIRKAYKRYSSRSVILRGLDMTVYKGSIYGLLGPSGCGKTTLLGCVAGYSSLDSGTIKVNLHSKCQLGYMPQDIALMELFTVSEMFEYFGKINGLSPTAVAFKGRELLNLMELSPSIFWKRVINSLSGGQQRRISLSVALLHDPLLLILDEPTVGLDPLISQKLWDYFVDLTEQNGKTIIITTHYIEEARQAHMIGLMRNGVLLAEAPPLTLLQEYSQDNLEDVFLLLSEKQSIVSIDNEEYPNKSGVKKPFDEGKLWDRKRMEAQIYKNTCWARRNIPIMTFMLVLPGMMMWLFGTVFLDTLQGVVVAAVNEEVLPDSCLHPHLPTQEVPRCKPTSRLSCRFLQLVVDKSYDVKEYPDLESAREAVVHGKARAVMHFPKKYSWSLIRRLSDLVITPDRYVNASIVDVYLDMAEMTTGFKINKDLRDSFEDFVKIIFKECRYNIRAAEHFLKFEEPIFGELSPKFTASALPGFIIPVTFFMTTFFSATSLGSEKVHGFLERCLITGVRNTELVFAHAVVQILMLIGQNLMVFTIVYGIYDFPLEGSWGLAVLFIAMTELQGMLYGFILTTTIQKESNITYCAIGTVNCLFLGCGMFWPLEGAHWIIHSVTKNLPIVMAVESYRSITIRGWGLSHWYILKSIGFNIGMILSLLVIFIFVRSNKK